MRAPRRPRNPSAHGKELLVEAVARQAMRREANDAAMLTDVVTIKEELERIREQVENLE